MHDQGTPATYILTNKRRTVLYTGSTTDIARRIGDYRLTDSGFAKKYNCDQLVWYESCEDISAARSLEYKIKGWTRAKKIALIESKNPEWKDLSGEIFG